MNRTTVAASAALCLSAFGVAGTAHAIPCSDLPNPVVVAGSTAIGTLLGVVAGKLAAATGADKLTVINPRPSGFGSCNGVDALGLDTDPKNACATGACVSGTVNYYTADGMRTSTCDVTGPIHVDVALSDVFKESCSGAGKDNANLKQESVAILPFGFIVPKASDQVAIDAREGYYLFGKGMTANIAPWTNPALVFQRNQNSGTQITIFKNLGIPTASAFGTDAGGSSGVLMGVKNATSPQAAIGIIGLDALTSDLNVSVKVLGYRHFGQNKYYYPSSTSSSFDYKNIRDGHYPLWSYEQAMYLVDSSGAPINPNAKKFIDILAGVLPLPDGDVRQANADSRTLPICAMDVSRPGDAKDFALVTEGASCGCFFEKAATGSMSASCKSCTNDMDCASGQKCRDSLCEAR